MTEFRQSRFESLLSIQARELAIVVPDTLVSKLAARMASALSDESDGLLFVSRNTVRRVQVSALIALAVAVIGAIEAAPLVAGLGLLGAICSVRETTNAFPPKAAIIIGCLFVQPAFSMDREKLFGHFERQHSERLGHAPSVGEFVRTLEALEFDGIVICSGQHVSLGEVAV